MNFRTATGSGEASERYTSRPVMSDPVLSIVVLFSLFIAIAAARWFNTVDEAFGHAAVTPFFSGALAGVAILFTGDALARVRFVASGVLLTLAAVYVRHVGEESDPIEGLLLGGLAGAAAAIPLILFGRGGLETISELAIAGSIAGFGITFGTVHAAARGRQLMLDGATAVAAVAGASIPTLLSRAELPERATAIAVTAAIPLVALIAVFAQSGSIRSELTGESALGFIDPDDVAPTAHPIRRFGRGGWSDPAAHRAFVRIARRIALRKRQLSGRPDAIARLYQLELIKLRMQLQDMTRIGRNPLRPAGHHASDDDLPSDRMQA